MRLVDELVRTRPELEDAARAIREGRVFVDGRPVAKPDSMIERGAAIVVRPAVELRGSVKLRAALDGFEVGVEGRVALDVGAAAGGFTSVLLEGGASRVYAVDAGHGQLIGSLRQNPRVVNLEATNISDLDTTRVPDQIGIFTVDVSYLSVAEAVPQLDRVRIAPQADLVALVKPMFELKRDRAPTDRPSLDAALAAAVAGVRTAWHVVATMDSPVLGAGGAPELFVHAVRLAADDPMEQSEQLVGADEHEWTRRADELDHTSEDDRP